MSDFIVADLNVSDDEKHGWKSLCGIHILPLNSGTLAPIEWYSEEGEVDNSVWLCGSNARFLSTSSNQCSILADSLSDTQLVLYLLKCRQTLRGSVPNIVECTARSVHRILAQTLPPQWQQSKVIGPEWSEATIGDLRATEWITKFWEFISPQLEETLEEFLCNVSQFSLLPAANGRLLPVSAGHGLIDVSGLDPNLAAVLKKLGCCGTMSCLRPLPDLSLRN